MKLHTITLIAALAGVSLVCWQTNNRDERSAPAPSVLTAKPKAIIVETAEQPKAQASSCPPVANAILKPVTRLSSMETQRHQINQLLAHNATHMNDLVTRAERGNDDIASMALFAIVGYCSPAAQYLQLSYVDSEALDAVTKQVCTTIPDRFRRDMLSILMPAITHGSASAKLVYAENALVQARLLEFSQHAQRRERQQVLQHAAEQYGSEAAQEGLADALDFMAQHHEAGSFGPHNSALAYAYVRAQQLRQSSQELTERQSYLRESLSPTVIQQAEAVANGCARSATLAGVGLANPFSQ